MLPTAKGCPNCGVHCERTGERVRRLQEEIERLRFELALKTGQIGVRKSAALLIERSGTRSE